MVLYVVALPLSTLLSTRDIYAVLPNNVPVFNHAVLPVQSCLEQQAPARQLNSQARILRIVKILRILKIVRILKAVKVVE